MNRRDGTSIPDDGIPVLTDVVDTAALPSLAETDIGAGEATISATEAPLSMAMFPELEPGADVELEREQAPFGADVLFAEEETAQPPQPTIADPAPFGFAPGFENDGAPRMPPDYPEAANQSTLSAPSLTPATDAAPGGESRSAMETRIFESLAARLDRLVDERLEPVIEGSIEAAFAGVKAGLSASLNQAIREAVEHAVRDEFEKRIDNGRHDA